MRYLLKNFTPITAIDKKSKYLVSLVFENIEDTSEIENFELIEVDQDGNEVHKFQEKYSFEVRKDNIPTTLVIYEDNSVLLEDSKFYQFRIFSKSIDFQFMIFHPELPMYQFSDEIALLITRNTKEDNQHVS